MSARDQMRPLKIRREPEKKSASGAGPSIALEFARDWTTPTLARHSMPLGQVGFSFFFELNILRMKQRTRSRGLDLQSFAYPYLLQVP
jgi:hypothetical protein